MRDVEAQRDVDAARREAERVLQQPDPRNGSPIAEWDRWGSDARGALRALLDALDRAERDD